MTIRTRLFRSTPSDERDAGRAPAWRSSRLWFGGIATMCLALALTSCAYPVRNNEAADLSATSGYRWNKLSPSSSGGTLVIVTASGGGTRAAALTLSVLEGLNQIRLADGNHLADEIDILSSVSGGSVTAGYFALRGPAGFGELENNFIRKDGVAAILAAGLNPVGLARLSAPSRERIDLLIDYLDGTLFHGQTFATLAAAGRRPFLILNAADMVEGIPFPMTQTNMDLLCSDLNSMKLSTAVAASAAFPVALSPVTLTDYSPCPAQHGIPSWVSTDAATNWYDNPERADRGRVELAYAQGRSGAPAKRYIHLLDGGVADNLGVSEPLRILTTNAPSPALLNEIARGRIKKIIFVMINARSFASSGLDQKEDTPGILDMLGASTSSSIDRATIGAAARVRAALDTHFDEEAALLRKAGSPELAANILQAKADSHLIEIDFDAIADPACRAHFHNIPTSWTLGARDIDALLSVGRALLAASPEFGDAVEAVGGRVEGSLPSLTSVCNAAAPRP